MPITNTHDQVRENIEAWEILKNFSKPTLAIFGKYDMSFRDQDKYIIEKIPGAKGLNHRWIEAGHFSQENQPELIAREIVDLV